MHPSDEDLVQRFQSGDEAAFVDIVARFDPAVLELAWRMTGDRDSGEDVRQVAWIQIHRGLRRFEGRARLSTWIHRIVLNLCHDRRRRHASRDQAEERFRSRRPADLPPTTPDEIHERRDLAQRVAHAVIALPPREREVVVLRHYHELPFPAIAEILEAPVTTVKSRMAKGLELLRARLAQLQGDPS